MDPAAQNPLNHPLLEVPNAPDQFGQDGGKFYRCYDTLAEELDEDMTKGLKEQLDGMLIFAGLFAGVNSAFLALTIPLLSADPADDTNALLAHNNAILVQLLIGRNDTVPTTFTLPSKSFSPAHSIYMINTLFALSLAFAIISSFLAVLGRQWLVYYRKRSGGGPDRQRWEQLERFLGAERWRLEPILDDVLPSLLQIGLIIFCASLILYLRYLSSSISLIVGIPLYVALVVFIGSALCTVWDRFCPFHSPLSHLLPWTARPLLWLWGIVRESVPWAKDTSQISNPTLLDPASLSNAYWFHSMSESFWDRPLERTKERVQQLAGRVWQLTSSLFHFVLNGREDESLELLQAVALQRAICTSDDPATLLHSIANILAITSPVAMKRLWDEAIFQQRFFELLRNSYDGMLRLRGYNLNSRYFSESSRRLYYSAAAHILLTLDTSWEHSSGLLSVMRDFRPATALIPGSLLKDSSPRLIKGSLGCLAINWALLDHPEIEGVDNSRNFLSRDYLTACSELLAGCSDLSFLTFFSLVAPWFRGPDVLILTSLGSLRGSFRGDPNDVMKCVLSAIETLPQAESSTSLDCDSVLTNILLGLRRIVADDQMNSNLSLGHYCKLLKTCDAALRSPQISNAARQAGRELRVGVARLWQRRYIAGTREITELEEDFLDPLQYYLGYRAKWNQTEFDYHENMAVVHVFGRLILRQLQTSLARWVHRPTVRSVCETFNALVEDLCTKLRQIQNKARRVRDPDGSWCNWKEEPLSIKRHAVGRDAFLLLPANLQLRKISLALGF